MPGSNFKVIPATDYALTIDGRNIYIDAPAKKCFANPIYKVSVVGIMGAGTALPKRRKIQIIRKRCEGRHSHLQLRRGAVYYVVS